MGELTFIQPQEMTDTTLLGGNVDINKYAFCINNAQISVIEPLLGTELYDLMITNFGTEEGNYAILLTDFIKPILKNEALAQYIEMASYTLNNGGIFKHAPADAEVVSKDEAQYLAGVYHKTAQMYIQRFDKWICKNSIPEYKTVQNEVDAQRNIKVTAGWYLGKPKGLREDELWS